jgi:hypothetical protein
LRCRLKEDLEVRAEAVARGRFLVANPAYPDDATERRLAEILAERLA